MIAGPRLRPGSMLPRADVLVDVLPTDRLGATGKPLPAIRAELRRIPNARNAITVIGALAQTIGLVLVAHAIGHPLAYLVAFLLMGRGFALLAILGHEAAHRLLFSNRRANDVIGAWLLAYPGFVPFAAYRRVHFAHHRDEMGPDEPDTALYAPYPVSKDSMRRKLRRDATGVSGWKNLRGLGRALRSKPGRPVALRIVAAQVGVFLVLTLFGAPWLYPVLWLAPWMTGWRVINRLRAIAEHGGMTRSSDRRETTHHVRQGMWARFWMVPYNTGWHLAHHVDMGIPFRNLPALHRELERARWVTPELTYPNYRALWRALSRRPTETTLGEPEPDQYPAAA